MALNTFKCKCLTPLHFKGLSQYCVNYSVSLHSLFCCSVFVFLWQVANLVRQMLHQRKCIQNGLSLSS